MHNLGKLIVMEGTDASGKATQSNLLYERLKSSISNIRSVKFPNYESDSSGPVRMYLQGDFGDRPEDVSPYATSALFAVDRFASYAKEWRSFLDNGGIVIADRYTTSNMVHQAAKIADPSERKLFLEWLSDFEFNKLGLPKPNIVFFLHVLPEVSWELMLERQQQTNTTRDIHEADKEHLVAAYYNACEVAKLYNWQYIECTQNGKMRTIEDIHQEIYHKVLKCIK